MRDGLLLYFGRPEFHGEECALHFPDRGESLNVWTEKPLRLRAASVSKLESQSVLSGSTTLKLCPNQN